MKFERIGRMGNQLKDIFSTSEPEFESKIFFDSAESRKKFLNSLDKISKDGEAIEIEGVNKIEAYAITGRLKQIIKSHEKFEKLIVGPSKQEKSYVIDTDFGKHTFIFETYSIDDAYVLETNKNEIISIKMIIYTNRDQNLSLTFKFNIQSAKNVKELVCYFNAVNCFINYLIPSQKENVRIKSLRELEKYWRKVQSIEKFFDITFKSKNFLNEGLVAEKNAELVNKLYFIFIEKKLLKESMDSLYVTLTLNEDNTILENKEIAISYTEEHNEEIYCESIQFFLQNFIPYAVIKSAIKQEENELKIELVGTDTKPLNLIYKGYKTIEEINRELDFNSIDFNEAKTLSELIN